MRKDYRQRNPGGAYREPKGPVRLSAEIKHYMRLGREYERLEAMLRAANTGCKSILELVSRELSQFKSLDEPFEKTRTLDAGRT
jgi:hypothetical protein